MVRQAQLKDMTSDTCLGSVAYERFLNSGPFGCGLASAFYSYPPLLISAHVLLVHQRFGKVRCLTLFY